MYKESATQIEVSYTSPGVRVPVVQFDYDSVDRPNEVERTNAESSVDVERARRETALRLLQFLTAGVDDPKDIGRRVLMVLHRYSQRGTLKTLAHRMHVTEARACQLYKDFKNLSS